jgi:hypothetical protein
MKQNKEFIGMARLFECHRCAAPTLNSSEGTTVRF